MSVIADTGFLVALQNVRDRYHHWAVAWLAQFSQPLVTCEAVLTETAYLLGNVESVVGLLQDGLVELNFDLSNNMESIGVLAAAYRDCQPDLADLCVVRMSELLPRYRVITTDRRDFTVYRRYRHEPIPLILPPE